MYVYKNADDKSIESTAEAINSEVTSIRAEGATEFSDKDVEKKIIVEGPNGESSEYLINVHIIKDTELLVENILYSLSRDFNVSALPGSFKKAEVDFKGQKVTAAQSSNSSLTLLYFFNEESSDALWYALDRNKGNIYPVQIKESEGEKYILISIDGACAYGENGFSLIDPETGEFLLTLTDGYDIESDESVLKSMYVIIVTLGVAITIVCICGFLWIKGKKGATPNEAQSKYFRPYIHLEDSQEDIEAKYEEESGKEF